MCIRDRGIKDYIKFRGLNKLIDEINNDLTINSRLIDSTKEALKPLKKELKSVNDKIKSVDENYYYLIDKLKVRFNLNELEADSYEQLSKNFCASGSNKPLSTVIWYLTCLLYTSISLPSPLIKSETAVLLPLLHQAERWIKRTKV